MRFRKTARSLPLTADPPSPGTGSPVHPLHPPDAAPDAESPVRRLHPPDASPLIPPCVDAVLSSSIEVLCSVSTTAVDPLYGEMLGSDAAGIWWMPSCAYGAPGADFERRIGYAYAAALDLRGGPDALAALRALQAGAAPGIVDAVTPTAERLAARGIPDPPWWDRVGGLRAVRAGEVSADGDDHRSRIVFVEVERHGELMTLGALTDADAAGVAASLGVFAPLDEVRASMLDGCPAGTHDDEFRSLAVAEARRRVLRAIERTDLLGGSDDYGPGFVGFRGLALRWMAAIDPGPDHRDRP